MRNPIFRPRITFLFQYRVLIIIIILIQPGPEFSLFAYWPAYSTAQYFLVGESRCIACCQYLDKGGEKPL